MKVLTSIFAVGLIAIAGTGMVLHKRDGRLPRWHYLSILVGSLALLASLVAWQITK